MRFLCTPVPGRAAAAGRRTFTQTTITAGALATLLFGTALPSSAQQNPQPAARTFTGVVVDQDGRPLPRVYINIVNENAGGFTGEDGRFEFQGAAPAGCVIQFLLTGFVAQTRPCPAGGSAEPLRIVLTRAAIGEYVVVSATRTEAPLSQVGVSATVFTAADLERKQLPLVADLLRQTTGAMVIRNGGAGEVTSLFVRGGESDYNKVLLDGVPLNEPGGNFYFSNLTTENLERVEVLRGAFSSLFGSDAMSSVVQLFTKRPDPNAGRPRGSVQLDGGTYDTMHFTGSVSGASERVDYSAGVGRLQSDNRVPNSRLENTTLSGNVGFILGGAATLRIVGRAELEHVGTPGRTAFGPPDQDAFFENHDGVGGATFDQQLTRDVRQRASYSLSASNQTSTDLILDPPYTATFAGHTAQFESSDFPFDLSNKLRRHRASYQVDWRLARSRTAGDHLVTGLADWDGERATFIDRRNLTETKASRNNTGVSMQDQIVWPRLFVTAGLRIESNDSFGTEAVPRATAVFVAHPGTGRFGETRVKASFGTGVKEPSLNESYSLSFFARGNPDLKPERSRSAEVGVDQRFADDRAKVEATYFNSRYEDLIWTQTTDFTTFAGQYFNLVGLSRAQGLELGTELAPAAAVRLRAGYTFLDSEIVESEADTLVFQKGQWAFRRPRHSGFVGVGVLWSRVNADVTAVFTGRFVDSDFFLFDPPITEIPAHNTWDASVNVKLTRQLTGVLVITNLTDRDYMEPVGYQSLRRVVRAGVRVGF